MYEISSFITASQTIISLPFHSLSCSISQFSSTTNISLESMETFKRPLCIYFLRCQLFCSVPSIMVRVYLEYHSRQNAGNETRAVSARKTKMNSVSTKMKYSQKKLNEIIFMDACVIPWRVIILQCVWVIAICLEHCWMNKKNFL